MNATIETVTKKMDLDLETVKPGQRVYMDALSVGDGVWQGDLGIMVVDRIPNGYKRVDDVRDAHQLVPGNTEGAKHCLDSMDGVELYRPANWGTGESLDGPAFKTTKERTIEHPKHGHVVVPSGMIVRCGYQREIDSETRRERRNAD